MRTRVLLFAIAVIVAGALPRATNRAAIIAYVFAENDLIDPAAIAADKLTHINYAFANIKDGEVVEGFARDAENFKLLAGLRRAQPQLGCWCRSAAGRGRAGSPTRS